MTTSIKSKIDTLISHVRQMNNNKFRGNNNLIFNNIHKLNKNSKIYPKNT